MATNPYLEITGPAFFPTVKPVVTTAVTEDIWRQRAKDGGWFVKVADDPDSNGGDLLKVEFLEAAADVPYGRLENVECEGDRFVATLCLLAVDGYAAGSETGALDTGDIGKRVAFATGGKLEVVDTGGWGRVVGGTKEHLRLAWNHVENVV